MRDIGHPIGGGRTPLVRSLARDGVKLDRHFIPGEAHYERRRPDAPGAASTGTLTA